MTLPQRPPEKRQTDEVRQIGTSLEFIEWATAEWGEPTSDEKARAEEIWSNR